MSSKNFVIVESPAKARTITPFLGSDYEVSSSYGHIRDLPKKKIGVDIEHGFEPTYEISPDKEKVVRDLKKAAKGKTVWLATDEDREGEAIAWHICHALGLDPATTKRIVFHEITKPAILDAVKTPRTVDLKLVDAQQARRILDRLVGYELSPVLWKKVRAGLSAGRVQSVAVRLIVEREREIKAFQAEASFKVTAALEADNQDIEAELPKKLDDIKAAKDFLGAAAKATFKIADIKEKPGKRSAGPPFTTSTLQQEASRRLGYGVRQTMTLAQRLYESGHITYMRTDSTNLSPLAIDAAKLHIIKNYGQKYSKPTGYKTKNQSAQEAHEAIRPTRFETLSAGADSSQKKLYELIWRRALASQMAPADIQKTEVLIDVSGRSEQLVATGEVLVFDGFLKVYGGGKDDKILPKIQTGQTLNLKTMTALETYSRPPARYSEAALVKKLEELGIGRPSTYAPTIGTIQDRGYIEKKDLDGVERQLKQLTLENGQVNEGSQQVTVGADRAKLVPTPLADIVTDFLIKYFGSVMDYDFTAKAEAEFDDVAEGKLAWQAMLEEFYKKFHPLIKASESASREDASQSRVLGKDPSSGQPISVRFARYGPVLQLGETPARDDKEAPKPRFAPLPKGLEMDEVTLEQALPMFDLPRIVGTTEAGDEILGDIGRFGPYLKVNGKFTSIKDADPLTITEAEARELLAAKAKIEKERVIADWGKLKILNGPYGPYITDGKKNARIAKEQDPKKLTEKEAKELLAKAPVKKAWRKRPKSPKT